MTPLSRIFNQRLLLVIGAMKAGTSSLHRYLDLHPDIAMSKKKELDYFLGDKNWKKGSLWYASKLRWSTCKYIGESSPNYTKLHMHPRVAERIHEVAPEARLIFSARDPLKRAVSHYLHNVVNGRELSPIEVALEPRPGNHYLETSLYAKQLAPFWERFGDRLLVLDAYQLSTDTKRVMRSVYQSLGLEPLEDERSLCTRHHESVVKTRRLRHGLRMLRDVRAFKKLRSLLPWLTDTAFTPPPIPSGLTEQWIDATRADTELLRERTGLAFFSWFSARDTRPPGPRGASLRPNPAPER
jgi:hypothetical protein